MQLDVQREASIAFERRGIHAERAGRGGRDPGGISHRIREVQLDPKVKQFLHFCFRICLEAEVCH